jgi:GntR family transcriptional regulator
MEFQVDPTTRVPIYRQLMDQIRLAVARGRLKPGSRLPSVRVLSRELVVNPNTIARVYTELERDGVLNTRPGMGVFVAEPQADLSAAARRQRLAEIIDSFLTDAVHLGFSADEVLSAVAKRTRGFQFVDSAANDGS